MNFKKTKFLTVQYLGEVHILKKFRKLQYLKTLELCRE